MKHKKLSRSEVIGQRITAIKCSSETTPEGFNYVEAAVVLENGTVFAVNEAGVDGPCNLTACDFDGDCSPAVVSRVASMIGRTITNLAVADSVPTLIVLAEREALFGMDTGPPFNGFAPTISRVGDFVDDDEIIDFWSRKPVVL